MNHFEIKYHPTAANGGGENSNGEDKPKRTKQPKNKDAALNFWTGGNHKSTIPIPHYEPPVAGQIATTGDLFGNGLFGTNGALIGTDTQQPEKPIDGLFKAKVTIWPPPKEESEQEDDSAS